MDAFFVMIGRILFVLYLMVGAIWIATDFKRSRGKELAYIKYVKKSGNLLVIVFYSAMWPLRLFVNSLNKYE